MRERWALFGAATGAFVAVLSSSAPSLGHGESDRERSERPPIEESAPSGEVSQGDGDQHFDVGVDFVAGFGKTGVVDQAPPASANVALIGKVGADPVQPDSFVLDVEYAALPRLAFGLRLPLITGAINPDASQGRSAAAIGNLELEGEATFSLSPALVLVGSFGVALPTAQGTPIPSATAALPATFDPDAYDRYSLNYAAAASRGFEDDALFFPGRLSLVPQIALLVRGWSRARLDPYARLENRISTSSSNSKGYVCEAVIGARAGYVVNPFFEPGVRVWTTLALTGSTSGEEARSVGVVELGARFPISDFVPSLGVVLPFAGALAKDPSRFVGVRLGASFAF
jgi:hypothetical protein